MQLTIGVIFTYILRIIWFNQLRKRIVFLLETFLEQSSLNILINKRLWSLFDSIFPVSFKSFYQVKYVDVTCNPVHR